MNCLNYYNISDVFETYLNHLCDNGVSKNDLGCKAREFLGYFLMRNRVYVGCYPLFSTGPVVYRLVDLTNINTINNPDTGKRYFAWASDTGIVDVTKKISQDDLPRVKWGVSLLAYEDEIAKLIDTLPFDYMSSEEYLLLKNLDVDVY